MIRIKKLYFYLSALAMLVVMGACSSDDQFNNESPQTKIEVAPEIVTLKSGTKVTKKGDKYLWQGDIVLSEAQLKQLDATGDIIPEEYQKPDFNNQTSILTSLSTGYSYINTEVKNTRSTAIHPTPYNLWAMVRFTYAKGGTGTTLNSYTKMLTQEALRYWEANTNIRFYNATDQPTVDPTYGFAYPYVNFCDGDSNESYIGRINGRQDLTLVPYGCNVGTVIHEIGHAIGLLHEQCRYDRDNWITVNTDNVAANNRPNFDKRTTNYYCIGSFDFNSAMLYSSYDFAVNASIPVITKKDGSTFTAQREGLSDLDRMFPNTFYFPYIARSDVYRELADVVYKNDNTIMSASERLQLQTQLNNGNPYPPADGRIPNDF